MLIKKLEINNFRLLKDETISFEKGLNLICGDNGNGKTHILEAIAKLLINVKPLNIKKLEDCVNWDAEKYTINFEFNHAGKDFKIKETYNSKSNTTDKELFIEGDSQPYINSDATEKLAQYFDPSFCKASIMAMQGIQDIVDATDSERRENFKKTFDIDFNKQVKDIEQDIKDIESEIQNKENEIAVLKNKQYEYHILEKLPLSESDYNSYKLKIAELEKEISELEKQINEYEFKLKEVSYLKQTLKDIEDNKLNKENSLSDLQSKLVIKNNKLNSNDFENKIKELQNSLNKDFEIQLREYKKELSILSFKRFSSFNSEELNDLSKQFYKKNGELDNVLSKIEFVKQGKCPTCQRDFDKSDFTSLTEKKDSLKKEIENIKLNIAGLEEKKKQIKEIEDYNNEIKNKQSALNIKIENEKKNIEKEKQSLQSQIEYEKQRIEKEKISIQEDIQDIKNNIENIKKEMIVLNTKIEDLNNNILEKEKALSVAPDKDLLNQKANEVYSLKQTIQSYESVLATNIKLQEANKKIDEVKKEDEVKLKELQKKRDKLYKEIDVLKKSKVILNTDFPNYIIEKITTKIENAVNFVIQEVYSGKYKLQVKQSKKGLSITYGKKKKDIRTASGFEKQLFNLAFKHSFAILSGLGILFLDEPDSFASVSNSKKLFQMIGNKLKDKFNQIIIITHKPDIQDMLLNDYNANCLEVKNGRVNRI